MKFNKKTLKILYTLFIILAVLLIVYVLLSIFRTKKYIENFADVPSATPSSKLPMIYFNFDKSSLTNEGIFKNIATDNDDRAFGYDQPNPVFTEKKNGDGCFDLNGKIINWGQTKFGQNGLTIAFWFKSPYASQGMNGKHYCIFGCSTTGAVNNDPAAFSIFMNANAKTENNNKNYEPGMVAVYYDNTGGDAVNTKYKNRFDNLTNKFAENTWTHFALTVENNGGTDPKSNATYTMYINGKNVNVMKGPYPKDPNTMSIGRQGDGGMWRAGPNTFMDDFALYRRVLSIDEIKKIMNESGMANILPTLPSSINTEDLDTISIAESINDILQNYNSVSGGKPNVVTPSIVATTTPMKK